MSLVLVVVVVALVVGRLCGGSVEQLGGLGLRRRRLVVGALTAQVVGALVGGPAHPAGLITSAGLAAAFLVANRGVRGTGLVALGLAANALVVALNGAMPVSPAAAARAQVELADVAAGQDGRHVVSGPRTRLPWLGDVVPVLLPLRPEVVSPGDVLVAAGLGQLVVLGMAGGRTAPQDRPPSPRATTAPAPAQPRPRTALPAPRRSSGSRS